MYVFEEGCLYKLLIMAVRTVGYFAILKSQYGGN